MKRLRRMVPLQKITERLAKDINRGGSQHPKTIVPHSVFGPYVSPHIQSVQVVDGLMILKVPDPTWRRELAGDKGRLLAKVKELLPHVVAVEVIH